MTTPKRDVVLTPELMEFIRKGERIATVALIRTRIAARISAAEAVDRMPPLTVALRILDDV